MISHSSGGWFNFFLRLFLAWYANSSLYWRFVWLNLCVKYVKNNNIIKILWRTIKRVSVNRNRKKRLIKSLRTCNNSVSTRQICCKIIWASSLNWFRSPLIEKSIKEPIYRSSCWKYFLTTCPNFPINSTLKDWLILSKDPRNPKLDSIWFNCLEVALTQGYKGRISLIEEFWRDCLPEIMITSSLTNTLEIRGFIYFSVKKCCSDWINLNLLIGLKYEKTGWLKMMMIQ